MAEEKKYRTQEEIEAKLYHDAMMAMQTTKLPRERTTGMTLPEFMAYWETKTLALITELETVRAQRDALRAALVAIQDECNTDYESVYGLTDAIDGIVDTALNTQPPQAEWTPRYNNRVSFNVEQLPVSDRGRAFELAELWDDDSKMVTTVYENGQNFLQVEDTTSPVYWPFDADFDTLLARAYAGRLSGMQAEFIEEDAKAQRKAD